MGELCIGNPTTGSIIRLNAVGSADPDGDSFSYAWSIYEKPGSYAGSVTIQKSSSTKVKLKIPTDAGGKTIHIIPELMTTAHPHYMLTAANRNEKNNL